MISRSPQPGVTPADTRIAYFSMEIAVAPQMPTYSGGLGMLAGDTMRSAADLGLPLVAVTLVHRKGYFRQQIGPDGWQHEESAEWQPEQMLELLEPVASITVQDREVRVRAWRHRIVGVKGHTIPVLFLDTDVEGNDEWSRRLTDCLYGGDSYYRLCQETVLGIGGVRMLATLGYSPEVFHMNEGHAALLSLGLTEDRLAGASLASSTEDDIAAVRQRCVFTTHTPVPAGHDRFGMDQMFHVLGAERAAYLERCGCCPDHLLNMTYVALRFSRYVNGVAMPHGRVSQQMFPTYEVHAITNGVHAPTWVSKPFAALYDREMPDWRHDNVYLRSAVGIPTADLLACHRETKRALFAHVAKTTAFELREDVFTIGFARRAATYKRADLLFADAERLAQIAHAHGGLQVLYGGKAHPHDEEGKLLIQRVIAAANRLRSDMVQIAYLENYEWELGALLTSGVDLWLNTPRRPFEASGTSGMKAALNGVPSLSTMDGWWIEGCVEGATGWGIVESDDQDEETRSLYDKLDQKILPAYNNPAEWGQIMRATIAVNGSFFNTQRMLEQYVTNAYFPEHGVAQTAMFRESVLV